MSFRSKLQKVKTQGYLRTLEVMFNRFVPPWIFRYSQGDIFDFDIEKLKAVGHSLSQDAASGLVARCLVGSDGSEASDDSERLRLRQFTWNSVPLETTADDFAYGIYDADDPQKLLGGLWAGIGSFSENNLGVKFHFTDRQAWLYCAFVHSDARGRGVYKKLISFVAKDLEQRGYSQLLGIVQPWNKVSRMMHEKQSRGICGRMSALRIFWLVWVSRSGNIDVDRRLVTSVKSHPANVSIN